MKPVKTITISMMMILSSLAMSSCRMYQEGNLTKERVNVAESEFFDRQPVDSINDSYILYLAKDFSRNGDGQVYLTVTYDPYSSKNTAMKAQNTAAILTEKMRNAGISPVQSDILPVQKSGDTSEALISYMSYTASPPPDCGTMAGYSDTDQHSNTDYRLGCTIETIFARQVARPRDLLGRGQEQTTSQGRSATNITQPVLAGQENKELKGQNASE
jgi:hypothetical protein